MNVNDPNHGGTSPSNSHAWETVVGGGKVKLRLFHDPQVNNNNRGVLLHEFVLTTAEATALGTALGGTGGSASSTHS